MPRCKNIGTLVKALISSYLKMRSVVRNREAKVPQFTTSLYTLLVVFQLDYRL